MLKFFFFQFSLYRFIDERFTVSSINFFSVSFFFPLFTEAKTQVLANLANFAYDPINYDYLRQLKVIDLFLHLISEEDEEFVRFAIGGLCNLCLGLFSLIQTLPRRLKNPFDRVIKFKISSVKRSQTFDESPRSIYNPLRQRKQISQSRINYICKNRLFSEFDTSIR